MGTVLRLSKTKNITLDITNGSIYSSTLNYVRTTNSQASVVCVLGYNLDSAMLPSNAVINSATLHVKPIDWDTAATSAGGLYIYARPTVADFPTSGVLPISQPQTIIDNVLYPNKLITTNMVEQTFDVTNIVRLHVNQGIRVYGIRLQTNPTIPHTVMYFDTAAAAADILIDFDVPPYAPNPIAPVNNSITSNRRPTFLWEFSDYFSGGYQTGFQVQVSDAVGVVQDSGYVSSSSNTWTVPANLQDGRYYYRIRTWNQSGLVGPWCWVPTFTVDTTPPNISNIGLGQTLSTVKMAYSNITEGQSFRAWANAVTDGYTGVQKVSFGCRYNGIGDFVWKDGIISGANNWYCDIPLKSVQAQGAEGVYQVVVVAYDTLGNSGQYWDYLNQYIDRTPPNYSSVDNTAYLNASSSTKRVRCYGVNDYSPIAMDNTTYALWRKAGDTAYNIIPAVYTEAYNEIYADVPTTTDGTYEVKFVIADMAKNTTTTDTATFFKDSILPSDPNPSVVWGQKYAEFTWREFSDLGQSSGFARTIMVLGEWTGTTWVGGMPNLLNHQTVATSTTTTYLQINGLKPGQRYRYTIYHVDKSGNISAFSYFEFVTKKKIGTARVRGQNGLNVTFNVYDVNSGVLGSKALRVALPGNVTGAFELVPTVHGDASRVVISTKDGARAIAEGITE